MHRGELDLVGQHPIGQPGVFMSSARRELIVDPNELRIRVQRLDAHGAATERERDEPEAPAAGA
jgi:hypothetical protein